MIFVGKNGKAASVSVVKVGDGNGKALNVVNGWVGDENGKAQRIWSQERPVFKFTCINGVGFSVAGSGLSVDFGDGTTQNIGTQSNPQIITHSYADALPHQVSLCGVLTYVKFSENYNDDYLQTVDTPFPKNNRISFFNNTFLKCTSLTSIPANLFDNCPNVIEFNGTFLSCTSLTSIPAGLFDNCPNVTSFNGTFGTCTNLAAIPAGLFDNCPNVTDFSDAFSNCPNLAAIPAGLFDNCPNVTDFSDAFWGCTAITSAVPELWDTGKWPNVSTHGSCFRYCTNAANYADIPADWK